jgi:hypothetical protein
VKVWLKDWWQDQAVDAAKDSGMPGSPKQTVAECDAVDTGAQFELAKFKVR